VLESGRAFGTAFVRRDGAALRVEVEQRLERVLAPGAACELEPVQVALGAEASALLEAFADAHGAFARARRFAPFQAGWCSWYHFFHDVTETAFLRNLEALAAARDEVPIDLVQLDDGYQRAIGDWLDTNEKFPSGLAALAHAVRDAGFTAGLWTAPFCVVPESRVHAEHPDWLLRDPGAEGAPLRGLHHGVWTKEGWVHVLDPTHPAVAVHLEQVYRALVGMGFTYLKLDFLYARPCGRPAATPTPPAPSGCAAASRRCAAAPASTPSCSAAAVRSARRSGWWTACASARTRRRTGSRCRSRASPASSRPCPPGATRCATRWPARGCTAACGSTIPTA
jgi:hypothetical protein